MLLPTLVLLMNLQISVNGGVLHWRTYCRFPFIRLLGYFNFGQCGSLHIGNVLKKSFVFPYHEMIVKQSQGSRSSEYSNCCTITCYILYSLGQCYYITYTKLCTISYSLIDVPIVLNKVEIVNAITQILYQIQYLKSQHLRLRTDQMI